MLPTEYVYSELVKPSAISLEGLIEDLNYSEEGFFTGIKSIFEVITIEEKDGKIRIDGMHGHNYADAIKKIWATSKIADNLFSKRTSNFVEFNSFFAIEVAYTLQKIINTNNLPPTLRGKRNLLLKILDDLYNFTWLKDTVQPSSEKLLDFSKLKKFTFEPLGHQDSFFNILERYVNPYHLKGYLLDAKPGAGKTLTALMVSEMLHSTTTIVCCPKKAVYDPWVKTLTKPGEGYVNPPGCWHSESGLPVDLNAKYFIVHYEAMKDVLPFLLANKDKLGDRIFVNLDESHNMNEIKSLRTDIFTDFVLAINPIFTLFMSGTPIKAIGVEAIPLLRCIDPFFTKDTEERFKTIWGKNQSKAIDILANRIGLISYVVPKEVFREGEPPIVISVKVKLPFEEAKLYTLDNLRIEMQEYAKERMALYLDNMSTYKREYEYCLSIHEATLIEKSQKEAFNKYKEYVKIISSGYDPVAHKAEAMYCNKYEEKDIIPNLPNTLKKDFRHYKSIIKYVHLKVLGECLGSVLGRRRTECNTALVKHCNLSEIVRNSVKKTLVFSTWVETIKEADQLLKDDGFTTTMVYGDTNKNLKTIIEDFGNKPEINPLLATYASLSEAIPMTMANTVVMLNLPFREKDWIQTVSRTDRIGQDTQVVVYEVTLDTGDEPNISTRSKDIMEWSTAQVMAIMGYDKVDPKSIEALVTGFMENNSILDDVLKLVSDNLLVNALKNIFSTKV